MFGLRACLELRTTRKAADKVPARQDGHVHDLSLLDEFGRRAVIIVVPKCLGLYDVRYEVHMG